MAREFLANVFKDGAYLYPVVQFLRREDGEDVSALVKTNPQRAANLLEQIDALRADVYVAKYMAYALGELGFDSSLPFLRRLATSSVSGVRSAAGAAIYAITNASANRGHTASERCELIDRAYYSS